MPVETAAFISDLNSAFPPDADPLAQADDHLRLIKAVLKATFPNLTGPVLANQGTLSNNTVPIGMIGYWYGNSTNIPAGWALCDGRTVSRSDGAGPITTPNMVGRFALSDTGTLATGGSSTHSHNLTIAGHALSTAELATHAHGINDPGHAHGVNDPGHSHTFQEQQFASGPTASVLVPVSGGPTSFNTSTAYTGVTLAANGTNVTIQSTGNGNAHGHPGSTSDSQNHLPPYIGLCPIMKV